MKDKVQGIINKIVFFAATLAIAAVFYEGMTLQWYSVVVVFILVMDYSFFSATIVNLIFRKNKVLLMLDIMSLVFITIAFVMKGMSIAYSPIALVLWYFYIWFLYGYRSFVDRRSRKTTESPRGKD